MSIEQVTVPLDGAAGIDSLINQINQQQPTQAMLQCAGNDMLCKSARNTLQQFAVPYVEQASAGGNQVVLAYEQLVTRDCDPKFVDNTINPYNLNHPNFGCSTASNIVNMVGDKRQFTNPAVLGKMDGSKAGQNYSEYSKPTDTSSQSSDFLLEGLSTSGN
jgi:hypothetical protein